MLKKIFPKHFNNKNIKMRIADIENEIIEEFELFGDDWEGKYEHLIDLGKHLPLIDKQHKTDDRLIEGCQSRVWLHSELYDEKVVFTADSDAIITKGMVAILIRVFSWSNSRRNNASRYKVYRCYWLKRTLITNQSKWFSEYD
jgi:sulfur transfer protein SufE